VKPAAFDYFLAESLAEALSMLSQYGSEARIIAGGQSLIPLLNQRRLKPRILIDISRIAALKYIQFEAGMLEVGATMVQAKVEQWPRLTQYAPLLAQAIPHIGYFQIRNRGTIGGAVAHAAACSELALCLVTLNGEVVLRSKNERRSLAAIDFQTGPSQTVCEPDEMIEVVRFPGWQPDTGYAFNEVALRQGDFAIVAVAATAGRGIIRLGISGVADKPAVRDWPLLEGSALDDALN
jgi:2-furoyl-CoA dehydrogenase FAD binding subunit